MDNKEFSKENPSEKLFFDTYEWVYVVNHPSTDEETEIVIYADTYSESTEKLKALKLPYSLKDYHLSEVVNFEPTLVTNIYTGTSPKEEE